MVGVGVCKEAMDTMLNLVLLQDDQKPVVLRGSYELMDTFQRSLCLQGELF